MADAEKIFVGIVQEILARFCVQNAKEPPAAPVLEGFGVRLYAELKRRGLPRPLGAGETGAPGELADEDCAPVLTRVLGDDAETDRDFLAIPLRQLIKACFHEEFKGCRDSFREASPDGNRRRQQLERVRLRASGTHCVDCPYWVSLTVKQHVRFLKNEWQETKCDEFISHREIFLPEDFRRLRRWLHACARSEDIGL